MHLLRAQWCDLTVVLRTEEQLVAAWPSLLRVEIRTMVPLLVALRTTRMRALRTVKRNESVQSRDATHINACMDLPGAPNRPELGAGVAAFPKSPPIVALDGAAVYQISVPSIHVLCT